MLPFGTLPLGLWIIAVNPGIVTCYDGLEDTTIGIDQVDHRLAVINSLGLLFFTEMSGNEFRADFSHVQVLVDYLVHSALTDSKVTSDRF